MLDYIWMTSGMRERCMSSSNLVDFKFLEDYEYLIWTKQMFRFLLYYQDALILFNLWM